MNQDPDERRNYSKFPGLRSCVLEVWRGVEPGERERAREKPVYGALQVV